MLISMLKLFSFLKKTTQHVVFFIVFPLPLVAQSTFITDVENFLEDMVLISNNYVSPAADAAVYQSTGSWYSTARSLDLFEIDVSMHVNVLPVPKSQKSFIVSDSDFISLDIRDAAVAEVPTALGGDTNVFYDFELNGDPYELQTFEGAKQEVFFYPYLQGSIGLWRQTEVTLQYIPKIKIEESGYQTFGGAVKHNISQYWLGRVCNDEDLQVAVQGAFSLFDSEIFFDDFEIKSTGENANDAPLAVLNSLEVNANAFTGQLIASKRVKKFEFVSALAVSANTFKYTMGGTGELIIDLLNESFTALEDTNTLLRGNIGVNYHFNDWYIASNFTIGKFLNTNLSAHYKF